MSSTTDDPAGGAIGPDRAEPMCVAPAQAHTSSGSPWTFAVLTSKAGR